MKQRRDARAGLSGKDGRLRAVSRIGCAMAAIFLLMPAFPPLAAMGESFPARAFGQEDGLENISVSAIAQDGQGYLWIGTDNGVFRYDGAEFEQFGREQGLANPSVSSLLIDPHGVVWVGNHSGLYYLEGDRFVQLQYRNQSLRVGMNSMLASTSSGELIAQSRNDTFSVLAARTRAGNGSVPSIVAYHERHPQFPGIDDPNGIAVDKADRLWMGCGTEVCVDTGAGLRKLGPADGVPADFYVAFFRSSRGEMWARGRKHILHWPATPSSTPATKAEDVTEALPAGAITTIYRRFAEDTYGHILAPTASGFASWDGKTWTETTSTGKGPLHGVTAMFSDREGAVWLGTQGAGLLQSLGYGHWDNYGSSDGLSNPAISAIAADRSGAIWLGNSQASNLLPLQGSLRLPIERSPLPLIADAANVSSFAPSPDGGMWASTVLGHIFHVDAAGRTDTRAYIDAYVQRLRLDHQGTLWAATSNGFFRLSCRPGKPCTPELFHDGKLGRANLQDMLLDGAGGAWLVGDQGLLRVPSLKRGESIYAVTVAGQTQSFSLIAPGQDGTLWLAGQMPGVIRVQPEGNTARVIEAYSRPQMASDDIGFLGNDRSGRLWAGTDHGVDVLDHGKFLQITEEDGLIWNDVGNRSFLADPDGSVWLGTSQGVSHLLHPDAILRRPGFDAVVNEASYNDKPVGTKSTIPWHGGITLLHFTGLTFRDNVSLVYHYQLDGFDSTPVTTHSHFARFQKLPPGNYIFRVVAEDPVHGVYSKPAEFAFTLSPPWWRTDLSYLVYAILAVAAVAGLWRLSIVALLAQKKKLEKLVAERTSELEQMALRDSLTGLLNRRAILATLEQSLVEAEQRNTNVCVALIDLDHFKGVNDTFGHLAGDEVLRQAAQRLANSIRSTDAVGRYGGEEFLIIFEDMEATAGTDRCEIVREAMCGEPIPWDIHELLVTCSIGLASSRQTGAHVPALVAHADLAMYTAKSEGRNRVVSSVNILAAS